MGLSKWLKTFPVALALLTRFGPSTAVEDSSLARSQPWFAPVGALLGIFYVSILYALSYVKPDSTWLLAWVYIALDAWATRGLHYDGLADIGDAVGSAAKGEAFWAIMRDSRIGAFGALALLLALSAQLVGIQNIIQSGQCYALIVAPIFGRILCVLFANMVPPHNPNSLGGKVCTLRNNALCIGYLLLSLGLMLPLGLGITIIVHLVAGIFFCGLKNIASKHGGCNGDFFGAIIIVGQCIVLLLC